MCICVGSIRPLGENVKTEEISDKRVTVLRDKCLVNGHCRNGFDLFSSNFSC